MHEKRVAKAGNKHEIGKAQILLPLSLICH